MHLVNWFWLWLFEWLAIGHVIEAGKQGNPQAVAKLNDTGNRIGFAVAHLINLFSPEMVVIGGPIGCKAGELLLAPIVQEAQRRSLPRALK